MSNSENNLLNLLKIFQPYKFLIFYLVSMISVAIITALGYFVKSYREIEGYKQRAIHEYKQLEAWHGNLENNEEFKEFVIKSQKKLTEEYKNSFKYPQRTTLPEDIQDKIYVKPSTSPREQPVVWKREAVKQDIKVYYGYAGIEDFDSEKINDSDSNQGETNRDAEKNKSVDNRVFQQFTNRMIEISDQIKSNDDTTKNLPAFSEVFVDYLMDNQTYPNIIPKIRVYSIYLFDLETKFLVSYPLTNQNLEGKTINYRNRPWFRATDDDYESIFENEYGNNNSGITGIYIDVQDTNKPNIIRTLWYKFQDNSLNQEYILCFDFFLEKSPDLTQANNLPKELIKPDNWIYLFSLSVPVGLCLYLIYEIKVKKLFIRAFQHRGSDLETIILKREEKRYASKDAGEISLELEGNTKKTNQSEQIQEAGWRLEILNVASVDVRSREHSTQEQETILSYKLTKEYNLNMCPNLPDYKCIETWRAVSKSSSKVQDIGFFVAKWNTNTKLNLKEVLDIQSIYWEKDYEQYLNSFREQLCEHLVNSDEQRLVPLSNTAYKKQPDTPKPIQGINSLEKIINSNLYLKQGKIVFSDVETLIELYKQGKVQAICSLHFIEVLKRNRQIQSFFQTSVEERYLIEYKPEEFLDFYQELDNETKSELINQSPFQIMVYEEGIENIIRSKDDFCIISIGETKLVAYSFTDDQHVDMGIGWISWREIDIQFYSELYKCQTNQHLTIQDIQTYVGH